MPTGTDTPVLSPSLSSDTVAQRRTFLQVPGLAWPVPGSPPSPARRPSHDSPTLGRHSGRDYTVLSRQASHGAPTPRPGRQGRPASPFSPPAAARPGRQEEGQPWSPISADPAGRSPERPEGPLSPAWRRASGEGGGPRSPSAPTVGSAVSYAKLKLQLERLRAAGHPGHHGPPAPSDLPCPPTPRVKSPRPGPQTVGGCPSPGTMEASRSHSQWTTRDGLARRPAKATALTIAIPTALSSPCPASKTPRGPICDSPVEPLPSCRSVSQPLSDCSSSSFGPSDVDYDPSTGASPLSPQPSLEVVPTTSSAESPARQPSPSRRRWPASPGPRPSALSPALDEEDLAVPWRPNEKLTKLNSAMLRLGLHYDVAHADPSQALQLSPLSTRHRSEDRIPRSEDGGESDNPRLRAVLRHEMHRAQELQDRIQRRDQRREWARLQAEDHRQREVAALRAAMWLTIIQLHAHSLPHRLLTQLQAASITRFVLPVWRRFVFRVRRRRARALALAQALERVERPAPESLRAAGPLFRDWPAPLLAAFAAELQLEPFAAAEYICHQGDPSLLLYVIAAGAVDVVLRRPDAAGKARGKRTGLTVAQLSPGKYVGEYGVFAGEPRAATLYCANAVVVWVAAKECLVRYLTQVPVPVYRQICATFEASMAKIYQVRPAQLASTVLFRGWDIPTLEQVAVQLQPVFFPEQSVLLEAGSPGTAVYIVAKGRCSVVASGAAAAEASAGSLLGLRACLFLEGQECEVRARTTVQAWRLPKAALLDFLLRRPDRFLAAKQRLNADGATVLTKPPLEELFRDSPLGAAPAAAQRQLYARLQPAVVGAMDPLEEGGTAVTHLWLGIRGRCTAGGAPLPAPACRCLGADHLAHRVPRWPHTVTATERVIGWRLALADVAEVLGAQLGLARHRAMRALLADVNFISGHEAPLPIAVTPQP